MPSALIDYVLVVYEPGDFKNHPINWTAFALTAYAYCIVVWYDRCTCTCYPWQSTNLDDTTLTEKFYGIWGLKGHNKIPKGVIVSGSSYTSGPSHVSIVTIEKFKSFSLFRCYLCNLPTIGAQPLELLHAQRHRLNPKNLPAREPAFLLFLSFRCRRFPFLLNTLSWRKFCIIAGGRTH